MAFCNSHVILTKILKGSTPDIPVECVSWFNSIWTEGTRRRPLFRPHTTRQAPFLSPHPEPSSLPLRLQDQATPGFCGCFPTVDQS